MGIRGETFSTRRPVFRGSSKELCAYCMLIGIPSRIYPGIYAQRLKISPEPGEPRRCACRSLPSGFSSFWNSYFWCAYLIVLIIDNRSSTGITIIRILGLLLLGRVVILLEPFIFKSNRFFPHLVSCFERGRGEGRKEANRGKCGEIGKISEGKSRAKCNKVFSVEIGKGELHETCNSWILVI